MRRLSFLIVAAVLAAGCGGSGGSKQVSATGNGAAGAGVAPKSSAFLLKLDTSFDSPQWQTFETLLRRFPGGEKALASLAGKGTNIEDLKAALGPETDLVALTLADLNKNAFIGLTQPDSVAKFETLLKKGDSTPPVSEQIADWRTIADDTATIDRFKQARNGGTLSGNASYTGAIEGLPDDAIASLFVDGAVLTKAIDKKAKTGTGPIPGIGRIGWLSGALSARSQGFLLDFRVKGDEIEAAPYTAELPAEVPANLLLFVDFKGLDKFLDELKRSPGLQKQLGSTEQALGGLLDELIGLFKGEGAFYIRNGSGKPEYTFVLKVDDETAAKSTLDKLVTLAGASGQAQPEALRIGRVSVQKIVSGKTALYFGVFDGKLVVTNAQSGITGLSASRHLTDSQGWRSATTAASVPDQSAGIFYADVQELVKLGKGLSKTLGKGSTSSISPKTQHVLDRLGTILVHGSVDNGVVSVKGFVSVR